MAWSRCSLDEVQCVVCVIALAVAQCVATLKRGVLFYLSWHWDAKKTAKDG
jgi:hypothetical protein